MGCPGLQAGPLRRPPAPTSPGHVCGPCPLQLIPCQPGLEEGPLETPRRDAPPGSPGTQARLQGSLGESTVLSPQQGIGGLGHLGDGSATPPTTWAGPLTSSRSGQARSVHTLQPSTWEGRGTELSACSKGTRPCPGGCEGTGTCPGHVCGDTALPSWVYWGTRPCPGSV